MSEDEHEQHRLAQQVVSRRKLLVAGTGIGAAGLATGIMGARRRPGPRPRRWRQGPPSPARSAPRTSPLRPARRSRTSSRRRRWSVRRSARSMPTASSRPRCWAAARRWWASSPRQVPTTQPEALFVPLDIPPGAALKQVDCYAFGIGSASGRQLVRPRRRRAAATSPPGCRLLATAGPGTGAEDLRPASTSPPSRGHPADRRPCRQHRRTTTPSRSSYQYLPDSPGFHPSPPLGSTTRRFNSADRHRWPPAANRTIVGGQRATAPAPTRCLALDVVPAGASGHRLQPDRHRHLGGRLPPARARIGVVGHRVVDQLGRRARPSPTAVSSPSTRPGT